ncbi:uncharacterized protein LOC128267001 [Anopheles cruzii]|uniref:uncharacterized protein LOC128267001 n=1 Tax=Anopheles cruzii TaxID=68878 RepID=UPI0022EC1E1F|nr:uncharacterized protein LOC128267001 [Anopheles cruzii]
MVLGLLSNQQLFQSDLQRSVHRLLRICQLFGAAPWSVTLFQDQHRKLCRRWKLHLVRTANALYSVGLMVTVVSCTVLQHVEFDCQSDCNNMPFMTRMLYICEYIMANCVVAMVLIGCHCQYGRYAKFADQLLAIAVQIAHCGGVANVVRIRAFFNRLLVGGVLYFAGVLLVDFLYNEQQFWNFCRSSAVYTLSNVINVLGVVQYFYLLYFVSLLYHDMNRLLKAFAYESSQSRYPQAHRLAYRLYGGPTRGGTTAGETTVVIPSGSLLDYANVLDCLRKAHLQQNKLIEQVNDCFGALIVLTTTASFVVLSLQFFAIYRAVTAVRPWTANDTYLLLYTVLWIVLHVAKVLLVLYPAHLAQKERDQTGPILYLFNHNEKDIPINAVLAKFSAQLLHEKGHQTACGVMNLEMTLISTMVGALTTYLVILIQFDTAVSQGQSGANSSLATTLKPPHAT